MYDGEWRGAFPASVSRQNAGASPGNGASTTRQPTVFGRLLPRNDFEGDDFTPGAHGHYVTCMDTSIGRDVAYATNGKTDKDGRVYRASIAYDPDGITLQQAHSAVAAVAHLPFMIPVGWRDANVTTHLRYGRGLVITGAYDTIPREYRYQASADFAHAMFATHLSKASGNVRVWDALNPDIHSYGRWYPLAVILAFVRSLGYAVGYVPLQEL